MDALFGRQRLILPAAQAAAAGVALFVALVILVLPTATLEAFVVDTGIAALVGAATPPLGITARLLLAILGAGAFASVTWAALFLSIGERMVDIGARPAPIDADGERAPVLRRADAHPDAPARRPLSAWRDLGEPFEEWADGDTPVPLIMPAPVAVPALVAVSAPPAPANDAPAAPLPAVAEAPRPIMQPLPADLDQPLAAFDAAAICDPLLPMITSPRRPTFDAGERFESYPLRPAAPRIAIAAEPAPAPRADPSASIHALLDRLERSGAQLAAAATAPPPPPAPSARAESLEDALVALRRMAVQR